MPTYEYRCENCGHEFEEFQSIMAKPTRKCPQCGKSTVQRLISAGAGIIFKGSGFYETDYRSQGYKDAAKKESDAAKPPETKSDGKAADAKPAVDAKPAADVKPVKAEPKPEPKVASKSAKKSK